MEESRRLIRKLAGKLARGKGEPDFFEMVRRIESLHRELPRIGRSEVLALEPVRFGQLPYLRFPQTSIASIEELAEKDSHAAEVLILVYFFGLYGVNGPMPLEVTNYVFERYFNEYDSTLRRFSDIVHHRFLSLFYRAWAESRLAVSFDRPESSIPAYLLKSLAGYPLEDQLQDLPKYAPESYANVLSGCSSSADGLVFILENFLQIPIRVNERVTSKEDIPAEYKVRFGKRSSSILGKNMQIGSHFLTKTKVFEIEIGPAAFEDCKDFLPGTQGFKHISSLIKLYIDRPLDWKLRVVINKNTLPKPTLNGRYQLSRGIWLGKSKSSQTGTTVLTLDGEKCSSSASNT